MKESCHTRAELIAMGAIQMGNRLITSDGLCWACRQYGSVVYTVDRTMNSEFWANAWNQAQVSAVMES